MGENKINGYFEYVVPPLEGLWWNKDEANVDYQHKENFEWISMIRQPEFVTEDVFKWACNEVKEKKGIDVSKAEFNEYKEQKNTGKININIDHVNLQLDDIGLDNIYKT